jgi:hypothetical protein
MCFGTGSDIAENLTAYRIIVRPKRCEFNIARRCIARAHHESTLVAIEKPPNTDNTPRSDIGYQSLPSTPLMDWTYWEGVA